MFALIASIGLFTSCDDEDADPILPTISLIEISNNAIEIEEGEVLAISFTIGEGESKIKEVLVKEGAGVLAKYSDSSKVSLSNNARIDFVYPGTVVAGTKKITITVIDRNDNSTEREITVVINAPASPISSYTAVLLYTPGQDQQSGTEKCALSTATGTTYTRAEGKADPAKIDILYVYGATTGATFTCPADAGASTGLALVFSDVNTWTTKNYTKFVSTSGVTFANLDTPEALQEVFDNGTAADKGVTAYADGRITGVAANAVVGFKTADGKYGVIRVVSISGTNNPGDSITIEVKVQK